MKKIPITKILSVFVPAAMLAVIIFFFLSNALSVKFIQDDAYTALRYVKNFLNGEGLVFNSGERVEGYTNFLWVVILSVIGFAIKGIQLETAAQALSFFFSTTVIILTFILSRLSNKEEEIETTGIVPKIINLAYDFVPVIMIAFSCPLIYWGVSGMESTMFVSLLLLSIIFFLKGSKDKPNYPFIIVSVLNSLLRPEGLYFFLLIVGYKIAIKLFIRTNIGYKQIIAEIIDKNFIKEIILFTLPLAGYLIFRIGYYGYILPNTFYAKTEFSIQFMKRGMEYFLAFNNINLVYGTILVIPVIIFIYRKQIQLYLLFYWLIFMTIAGVILIGGDVLPVNRFFLPIIPLIYILLTQSIRQLIKLFVFRDVYVKNIISVFLLLFLITISIVTYQNQKKEMLEKRSYEVGLVEKMKIYAKWVNDVERATEQAPRVAMSTIGAFSYFSSAKVIDIAGLTDSYISHHPKETPGIDNELPVIWKERHYNADYVFQQKPDFIIFPAGGKPSAFAECALFVNKEFQRNYYTQLFFSEELNQLLPIFTKRSGANNTESSIDCNVRFVKHFISANNYFLEMLESRNKDLLRLIKLECDSVVYYCPQRRPDALTILGYSYYHAGEYDDAKMFLNQAAELDPFNAIARLYLKSIMVNEGDIKSAVAMMLQIKKYSPDALPDFNVKF